MTHSDDDRTKASVGEASRAIFTVWPQLVDTSEGRTLKESLEATEKRLIEKALEKTGGNQTRAAKELGISRVWLRKKMEKYDLLTKR